MRPFDETQHARAATGQFTFKQNAAPASALVTVSAADEAAEPLTVEELMTMMTDGIDYQDKRADVAGIDSRRYADVDRPSVFVNRDRPSFTGPGERDFGVALERIDAVWEGHRHASIPDRSAALLADARIAGAMSRGAGAAQEAYARAIILNESAGYIDEQQVNHTLDVIAGGGDVIGSARGFGYPPSQYAADLAHGARSAAYRAVHGSSAEVVAIATERKRVLDEFLDAHNARADRGWSSREEDVDDLHGKADDARAALRNVTDPAQTTILAARVAAYEFALDTIHSDANGAIV